MAPSNERELAARRFLLGRDRVAPPLGRAPIPIRKDNRGKDINLVSILAAFENSQLAQLKRTIDTKDKAGFERSCKDSLTVCYSCHTAADKPYLGPHVPAQPASPIMNFDPKAKWPL